MKSQVGCFKAWNSSGRISYCLLSNKSRIVIFDRLVLFTLEFVYNSLCLTFEIHQMVAALIRGKTVGFFDLSNPLKSLEPLSNFTQNRCGSLKFTRSFPSHSSTHLSLTASSNSISQRKLAPRKPTTEAITSRKTN
jgi:hypothetical protein